MAKKYGLLPGEESGDIYGSRLARELKNLNSGIKIEGMGGQQMQKSGVEILVDSTELGVVGLIEVFGTDRNLSPYFQIACPKSKRIQA